MHLRMPDAKASMLQKELQKKKKKKKWQNVLFINLLKNPAKITANYRDNFLRSPPYTYQAKTSTKTMLLQTQDFKFAIVANGMATYITCHQTGVLRHFRQPFPSKPNCCCHCCCCSFCLDWDQRCAGSQLAASAFAGGGGCLGLRRAALGVPPRGVTPATLKTQPTSSR